MYKYWCTEKEEVHEDKPDFYFDESGDITVCPDCGGKLKLLGETTNFFAKIGSMSIADRRAALLKRSAEHTKNNTEIQDRKEWLHHKEGLRY